MSESVFTVENVDLSIGKHSILHSVSLEVASGGCTAIIGPNGAGKTTLLKCLNRILKPDSGAITLRGRSLSTYAQKEIALEVAYVPQASGSPFTMTVAQFVLLGRYPHISPFSAISKADHAAVDEALDRTGIADFRDRALDTLSGGERQSAYIAAALAQGGSVLLMDEPTTYLDYAHQVDVLALVKRLHCEQGMTIVIVTHDVNHAAQVSDHIVALRDGKVVFDDTPRTLIETDALESIYDTPFARLNDSENELPTVIPTGGTQ
jgi:iron complex transport system ATP-binding protein